MNFVYVDWYTYVCVQVIEIFKHPKPVYNTFIFINSTAYFLYSYVLMRRHRIARALNHDNQRVDLSVHSVTVMLYHYRDSVIREVPGITCMVTPPTEVSRFLVGLFASRPAGLPIFNALFISIYSSFLFLRLIKKFYKPFLKFINSSF